MIRLLFISMLTFHSQTLLAFCPSLDFHNIPSIIDLSTDATQRVDLNVARSTIGDDCRYRIGIDRGQSPNYNRKLFSGTDALDFILATNQSLSRIIMDIPDASNKRNYIQDRMKKKGPNSKAHSVYTDLVVPANKPAGIYHDHYYLKLYQRTSGNNYPLHSARSVTFRYIIPESISLSLVASNAPFDRFDTSEDLNFGVLTSGVQRSFDIVIQTNDGYILNISSQNDGSIKHTGSSTNSTIAYTFSSNGTPVNLNGSSTNPVVISTRNGQHTRDGFRVPIQVIMGNVQDKLAGSYRDDLTVTVTTNL